MWMTVWYASMPDSHPHRVTNTKCRTYTVISPDDGHILAQNMHRKKINVLRKIVHQVGSVYKIIQGFTVNKTQKVVHSCIISTWTAILIH